VPTSGTCVAPIVLPAAGGTFAGATSGTSALAGTCNASNVAPEMVYRWSPTRSGQALISTCGGGTSYDTAVYVRSGSCAGTELACNDDTPGCANGEPSSYHGSSISLSVTAGATYVIVVDGYADRRGTFTLNVVAP
jgi:hypothetical protein